MSSIRDISFPAEIDKETRHFIVFAGAGISKACGLTDWNELASKMYDKADMPVEYKSTYLEELKHQYPVLFSCLKKEMEESNYFEFLQEEFAQNDYKNNDLYKLIARFSPQYFITTNYETILEDYIKNDLNIPTSRYVTEFPVELTPARKIPDRSSYYFLKNQLSAKGLCSFNDNEQTISTLKYFSPEEINSTIECKKEVDMLSEDSQPKIIYLHGNKENINSIVLDEESYYKKYDKPFKKELVSLLKKYPFIFLGCSFNDFRIRECLVRATIDGSNVCHYALMPKPAVYAQNDNAFFTTLSPETEFEYKEEPKDKAIDPEAWKTCYNTNIVHYPKFDDDDHSALNIVLDLWITNRKRI